MNYTEDQMTGWYNLSDQKPWEPGVYELSGGYKKSAYSYWNGDYWMYTWDASIFKIYDAFLSREDNDQPHWFHELNKWRGLNHKPNRAEAKEQRE